MKILVTGKDGQLGFELQRTLAPLGSMHAVGHRELDLRNADAICELMRSVRPDIVVNAGAYTDVNKAESERDVANEVNGRAPGVLAEELKRYGGRLLVHFSTDYVFDGSSTRPYREDDPTNPINAYGASKLLGEQAIQEVGAAYLIFRTEWVYATRGRNFLLTILRLAREGKPMRVVDDQVGAPTWSRMIAEATAAVLAQLGSEGAPKGVYHITAAGQATWYQLAEAILTQCATQASTTAGREWCKQGLQRLSGISSAEFSTPARRPAYSLLCNDKLAQTFGICCSGWRDQLCLALCEHPLSV
jgi:dTDP-4-dehydrorhamnose reductase